MIFCADFRRHFAFICHVSPSMFEAHVLCEFVQNDLKSLEVCVILSHLVFDSKFFSVTIYKVGKCMMPSVLKSVQILKSV